MALSATYLNHRRRIRLLVGHAVFTIGLAAVGLAPAVLNLNLDNFIYFSCLLTTLTYAWILGSSYFLKRDLLDPYFIFMISVGLFSGGQACLELFGLNPSGVLAGRFAPQTVVSTLYLVAICGAFIHGGALIVLGKSPFSSKKPDISRADSEIAARTTGLVLLAASLVPTVMLLRRSVSLVMESGYFELFRAGDPGTWLRNVAGFFVPGVLFLLAGSRRRAKVQVACLGIVAGTTFLHILLGSRAAGVLGFAPVLWMYDRCAKRVSRKLIVAIAFCGLVAFSLVRETRGIAGNDRFNVSIQYQTLTTLEAPVVGTIAEMGGSLLPVAYTLEMVPSLRDFDWGASYWYAVLTIVPNTGSEVHPSVAHGLLSNWLVNTVDPVVANAGGGLGYSPFAEAYLNFGWFGAPIALGTFGCLVGRMFLLADSADIGKQAMVGCLLASILIFPRGEAAIVVRGIFWYAFMPYVLMKTLALRRRQVPRTLPTRTGSRGCDGRSRGRLLVADSCNSARFE